MGTSGNCFRASGAELCWGWMRTSVQLFEGRLGLWGLDEDYLELFGATGCLDEDQ